MWERGRLSSRCAAPPSRSPARSPDPRPHLPHAQPPTAPLAAAAAAAASEESKTRKRERDCLLRGARHTLCAAALTLRGAGRGGGRQAILGGSARVPSATGPLTFAAAGDPDGRLLERTSGRVALVNRQAGGWASLGLLDLAPTELKALDRTVEAALGQAAWEEDVVEWGGGAGPGGGKPPDTCACVVWTKMGPHSKFTDCRSASLKPVCQARARCQKRRCVLVTAALVFCVCAVAVLFWRPRPAPCTTLPSSCHFPALPSRSAPPLSRPREHALAGARRRPGRHSW